MADEKQDTSQRAERTERTPAIDTEEEGGSTVHGGGLGGNELGSRPSAVGTVTESDLKPGERRRSGYDVKE